MLAALALSEQMIEWFRANYAPCDDGEYDAREELEGNFRPQLAALDDEEREEILDLVTTELEDAGSLEWEMIRHNIGKTTRGRKLQNCPGDLDWGTADAITCKACLSAIQRRG
jgi:hypothetical protein